MDIPGRVGQPVDGMPLGGMCSSWHRAATVLRKAAMFSATLGGLALCGLAIMLTVSILARKTMGWQVRGDVEIVQMGGAVASSLLFAWCQVRHGNVAVDFATKALPSGVQKILDRTGYFILGCLGLLLAVRTVALGLGSLENHAVSTLLAWIEGYWQLAMVPGLALFGVIGLFQSFAPRQVVDDMAHAFSCGGN